MAKKKIDSKELLSEFFRNLNKIYLDSNLKGIEPFKIDEAHFLIKDENFNKPIAEIKYKFSKN